MKTKRDTAGGWLGMRLYAEDKRRLQQVMRKDESREMSRTIRKLIREGYEARRAKRVGLVTAGAA